ncbi:DNA polymerase III subunit alpha, partial [Streptomyces sp. NPDC055817]
QPTPGGDYPMLQADKEDVEDLGLLKLDVLGVRMQSAMAHADHEIRRTTGKLLDLDNPDHVPLDDGATFEMIRRSDTLGCFQIESPGQMDLVGRLQPRHMQDVIADISLFRPGPVKGGMPAKFIAARHGASPRYPHPDLPGVPAPCTNQPDRSPVSSCKQTGLHGCPRSALLEVALPSGGGARANCIHRLEGTTRRVAPRVGDGQVAWRST